MAASPIAAFPVISALVTVHLYGYLGADECTNSTAGTFVVTFEDCRQITGGIQLAGRGYKMLGAEGNAQLTSLAQFLRNFDSSFYISHGLEFVCVVRKSAGILAHIIVFGKVLNYKFFRLLIIMLNCGYCHSLL